VAPAETVGALRLTTALTDFEVSAALRAVIATVCDVRILVGVV
jgi:uncharacterized protein YjgD (DUF1641 family)